MTNLSDRLRDFYIEAKTIEQEHNPDDAQEMFNDLLQETTDIIKRDLERYFE